MLSSRVVDFMHQENKHNYFLELNHESQFELISDLAQNQMEDELDNLINSGINLLFKHKGRTTITEAAFRGNIGAVNYFTNRYPETERQAYVGFAMAGNFAEMIKIYDPESSDYDKKNTFRNYISDVSELFVAATFCAMGNQKDIAKYLINLEVITGNYNTRYFPREGIESLINSTFTESVLNINWDEYISADRANRQLMFTILYLIETKGMSAFIDYVLTTLSPQNPKENKDLWGCIIRNVTDLYGIEAGMAIKEAADKHFPQKPAWDLHFMCGLFRGLHINTILYQLDRYKVTAFKFDREFISINYSFLIGHGRRELMAALINNGWPDNDLARCALQCDYNSDAAVLEVTALLNDRDKATKTIKTCYLSTSLSQCNEVIALSNQIHDLMREKSILFKEAKRQIELANNDEEAEPVPYVRPTFSLWTKPADTTPTDGTPSEDVTKLSNFTPS